MENVLYNIERRYGLVLEGGFDGYDSDIMWFETPHDVIEAYEECRDASPDIDEDQYSFIQRVSRKTLESLES